MKYNYIVAKSGPNWYVYSLVQDLDGRAYYTYFASTDTYKDAETIVLRLNRD